MVKFSRRTWRSPPWPASASHFLRIRHLPVINQVLCLCIAFILLPPVSYDYTLLHLYVPWGLLVMFAQEQQILRREVPGLTAAFVCLGILMAPLMNLFATANILAAKSNALPWLF